MSWTDVGPLDSPQYEELSSITRCLHLKQATSSYRRQKLASHTMKTRKARVRNKVLWFAPTEPMNQNNMYGNVSFTLDWNRALKELGPHLYYIDQKRTHDIVYSRVLLTNRCYVILKPMNDMGSRMPIKKLGEKYYVATVCGDVRAVRHVVEIAIEESCSDGTRSRWLFANSKIQVNDHSLANKRQYSGGPYNPCICHRFNYFEKVCPTPYSAQETRAILDKKFPEMLRDTPSENISFESASQIEDDKIEYEEDEYIANYDDHDNTSREVVIKKTVFVSPDSDDDDEGNSHYGSARRATLYGAGSSYGARYSNGAGSSYGARYSNGAGSSYGARYSNGAGPSYGPRYSNDAGSSSSSEDVSPSPSDGWSTVGTVAVVAGGLSLLAGLAALTFAGGRDTEEDKKKKKNWWE